jgi:Cache 3/Cache 2 fusion domain
MYRNNFFAYVLAVACFTILTPSPGAAQTAIVKSLMAALRADTEALGAPKVHKVSADTAAIVKSLMAALRADIEALGAPKVQGGDLYFGNTKVSADTIGFGVVKRLGGDASVFVKSGDQFVRVATTLKKEDGTSAVGTALAGDSPALPKLNAGQAYYGDATTFGKTYDTGYVPIKDASGAVIGAFFVGNPK